MHPGLVLALLPWMVLLRAMVAVQLWKWFIVPLGMEPIGVAHAIGLSAIVAIWFYQRTDVGKTDNKALGTMVLLGITSPCVLLGMGWIASLFM